MGKRWHDRNRGKDDEPVLIIPKVLGAADMHQYDDDVQSSRLTVSHVDKSDSSMLQSSSISTSITPSEAVSRSSAYGTERSAIDSGSFFSMAAAGSSGMSNQHSLGFIESKPRSIVGTLRHREKPRKRQLSPDNSMVTESQTPSSSSGWSSKISPVADDDDDEDLYRVDPEPTDHKPPSSTSNRKIVPSTLDPSLSKRAKCVTDEETTSTRREEVVRHVSDVGETPLMDPRRRSTSTDSRSRHPPYREREPISLHVPPAWKAPVKAESNISAISSSNSSTIKPPSHHSAAKAENSKSKRSLPLTDKPSTSTNTLPAKDRRNSDIEMKPDEIDFRPIVNSRDRDVVNSAIPFKEKKVRDLEKQLNYLKNKEIELKRNLRANGGNSSFDLENNLQCQQKVIREMESTKESIDNMRKKIARYDESKAQRVAAQAALVVKTTPAPKQPSEPLAQVKGEVALHVPPATPTPSTPQIQYRFFDNGQHWCKHCNDVFPFLSDFLKHLHDKHSSMVASLPPANRPWFNKPKEEKEAKIVQSLPIKGVEFIWPSSAFYCELCKEFYGDGAAMQLHLGSENHNMNYKKYTQSNPSYEKKTDLEKNNSLMKKRADIERSLAEVMKDAFSENNANTINKGASTSNKDNASYVEAATVLNAESAINKEIQPSINENMASTSKNTQAVGFNQPVKIKEEPKDSGYEKYMGNQQMKGEKHPVEKAVGESLSRPVVANQPAAEEMNLDQNLSDDTSHSSNLVITSVTSIKKESFPLREEIPEERVTQPAVEGMNLEENLSDHTANSSNLIITSVTSIKKESFPLKEEVPEESEDANLDWDSDQETVPDPMEYPRDDDFI